MKNGIPRITLLMKPCGGQRYVKSIDFVQLIRRTNTFGKSIQRATTNGNFQLSRVGQERDLRRNLISTLLRDVDRNAKEKTLCTYIQSNCTRNSITLSDSITHTRGSAYINISRVSSFSSYLISPSLSRSFGRYHPTHVFLHPSF